MTTVSVWLLVFASPVHGGYTAAIQSTLFPTLPACEQVAKNSGVRWARCIQTEVIKTWP